MTDSIRPRLKPHLTSLPRGPHGLAQELVTGSQRQRLLYAMTVVVAEKGYLATTVADVTSRAGVSRKTFYALFADKEECFIAAAEASRELTIKCLKASFAQSSEQSLAPVATLRASIRAYLRLVAEEPEFAKAFFLETCLLYTGSPSRCASGAPGFLSTVASRTPTTSPPPTPPMRLYAGACGRGASTKSPAWRTRCCTSASLCSVSLTRWRMSRSTPDSGTGGRGARALACVSWHGFRSGGSSPRGEQSSGCVLLNQ